MDQEKIISWVELYTNDLYKWAYYKTQNRELAQDLVQDTFLVATEKIQDFQENSTPKTWLFSILNNKIIDIYRKSSKMPLVNETDVIHKFFNQSGIWQADKMPVHWRDEEHLLDNADFQAVLLKCLQALPEKWRHIIQYKFIAEKNNDAICKDLEISTSNLWQIIHRAKLQLRNCVETNWN